jgi:alpha-aminoadipic semialdehyde synthase
VIGIRREDKNRWERRVPLTPEHVAELTRHGVGVRVERSSIRAFRDESFARAGAELVDDLPGGSVIVGVKEVPVERLHPETPYLFFAHVVKGQRANMPLLARMLELRCTLVDFERIVDDRGRRLVFFGRHAGLAGMLDTLATLGRRLVWEGLDSPFAALEPAHAYADLETAHAALARAADAICGGGLPDALHPAVFGFTGSGNVAKGAQEVFEHLPYEEVLPEDLAALLTNDDLPRNLVYKVVFTREDRIAMGPHLPHLIALVNGVYWEPGHPRVVSVEDARALYADGAAPRLRVIGDISCDLAGSIELTVRIMTPGEPVYVYDPETGATTPGVAGRGPVILAVDNLPCELPVDASQHFGDALLRFLPSLARCDWSRPLEALELPDEIRRAIIAHRGRLAPPFVHLSRHLP